MIAEQNKSSQRDLLKICEYNARQMLRAADFLRQCGFDDMAIALHGSATITNEAVRKQTHQV